MSKVGALELGNHDRHPQELDELCRCRKEREGNAIPAALALGEEPNDAAGLSNLEDGADGLEIRDSLGLGDCTDELQEVALEGRTKGLICCDPVYGIAENGADHEGIPIPNVVSQDQVGRLQLLEYARLRP